MNQNDKTSIETYIRENQGKYSRYAITQHLLANGWSKEDIDEVWATVVGTPEPGLRAHQTASRQSGRDWIGVLELITTVALRIIVVIAVVAVALVCIVLGTCLVTGRFH